VSLRPALELLFSCVILLLMTAGSLVVLQLQARRDRWRARITRATAPHRPRAAADASDEGVALAAVSEGLARVVARVFGFDPALQDHYVMRWWLAMLLTLLAAMAGSWLGAGLLGTPVLLAILPGWICLSRGFFAWCETRRRNRLFVQFPDALATIVRAVRVGIPVSDAMRTIGRELPPPTGPEFARLADELSIGVVLEEALQAMSRRNGLQEYHFFATALSLQNQTGGGLGETLENLADVIRKRVAVRERGRALSAEAQASALVLTLLPPLAMAALWLTNPAYIGLLISDPTGRMILGAAAGGLCLGTVSMRLIISRSLG
jgi:tight adherence protein B